MSRTAPYVQCVECNARVLDINQDRIDHAIDEHGVIDSSDIKYIPLDGLDDGSTCLGGVPHRWKAADWELGDDGPIIHKRRCIRCGDIDTLDTEGTEVSA